MKKALLILFVTLYVLPNTYSQTITGKIISKEDLQPLPGATIKIFYNDSVLNNTYISNNEGIFSQKITVKEFNLNISYIGYKNVNMHIQNYALKDIDLGSIIMSADNSKILDDVTITAKNIRYDTDKMVVFPSIQQLKSSTKALDLLQHLQLSGLFVDPIMQKVSIAGTSDVIYKINGVNATLKQVAALKADQIQRIEYSKTPSIREADTNSGYINVIIKKEETGTYLNTSILGAVSTGFLNGDANIKTVFGKSELALDYYVNWRDYNHRWSTANEKYCYPDYDTIQIKQDGRKAPFGYLMQDINLTYAYNNTQNIFIFRFLNSINRSFDRNYIDLYKNANRTSILFRNIHSKSKDYTPSLDMYYSRIFDEKQGIDLNLVGTLMNSDYNRSLVDTYHDGDSDNTYIKNTTNGNKKSLIFESFYYNRKHKINYNIGLKSNYSHTNNKYNSVDINKINRLSIYPYISISSKIKNLSYTLGTGLQVLKDKDYSNSKNYFKNLTTLTLFYKKNDSWNIKNMFRFTPNFPNLSDLNEIDQKQDSLMIVRGNPLIKPSQTIYNKIELNCQMKSNINLTFGLNFRKTFDPIRNNYYFDTSVKSFITQRDNLKNEHQIGSNVDFEWNSILNIFNISSGAAYNHYQSKDNLNSLHLNSFDWYFFLNAQIKNISIDAGYKKPAKELTGQVIYLNENYSSVGISYKKNNLSINGGVILPFTYGTKYRTDIRNSAYQSVKNIYIKNNANMFYFGLSYNISWGKSIYKINKRLNNADRDNGILKIKDN